MSEPDDPSRLLDSASAPYALKQVLRVAQADLGSDEQLARLARRLGPLLGAVAAGGVGVGAASATGSAAQLGVAAKLGIGALALLAAGASAFWLSAHESRRPSPSAQSATKPAPLVAPDPKPLPHQSASEPEPEPALPPTSAPPALAPPLKVQNKVASTRQLSEAELLEQARAASKSDPARTLQRANEHALRFPHGVLIQEREVLAIQAPRRLGRDAEADRRADAFAKAFPGSAFQRKLKPNP